MTNASASEQMREALRAAIRHARESWICSHGVKGKGIDDAILDAVLKTLAIPDSGGEAVTAGRLDSVHERVSGGGWRAFPNAPAPVASPDAARHAALEEIAKVEPYSTERGLSPSEAIVNAMREIAIRALAAGDAA